MDLCDNIKLIRRENMGRPCVDWDEIEVLLQCTKVMYHLNAARSEHSNKVVLELQNKVKSLEKVKVIFYI